MTRSDQLTLKLISFSEWTVKSRGKIDDDELLSGELTLTNCLCSTWFENLAFWLNFALKKLVVVRSTLIWTHRNSSNAFSSKRGASLLSLRSKSLTILDKRFRSDGLERETRGWARSNSRLPTYSRFARSVDAILQLRDWSKKKRNIFKAVNRCVLFTPIFFLPSISF